MKNCLALSFLIALIIPTESFGQDLGIDAREIPEIALVGSERVTGIIEKPVMLEGRCGKIGCRYGGYGGDFTSVSVSFEEGKPTSVNQLRVVWAFDGGTEGYTEWRKLALVMLAGINESGAVTTSVAKQVIWPFIEGWPNNKSRREVRVDGRTYWIEDVSGFRIEFGVAP